MTDGLNAADCQRQNPAATTNGLGDRLVHVSGGLGRRPRQLIKAAAGRHDEATGALEQFARWFTQPARDHVWSLLTGTPTTTDDSHGVLHALLRATVWLAVAALGVALLVTAMIISDESWWTVLLAGIGLAAILIGLAVCFSLTRLKGLRDSLGNWIRTRLEHRLAPRNWLERSRLVDRRATSIHLCETASCDGAACQLLVRHDHAHPVNRPRSV